MTETSSETPTTFYGVNPIFRVKDLAASLACYPQKLGFTINWQYPYIASVKRGRTDLFLSYGDQGNPGSWVWIGVSDAEAVHREFIASGAIMRNPPTNFAWALEMQVEDLDGNILRIGSDSQPGRPFGPWLDMYGVRWHWSSESNWTRETDA